MNEPHTHISKSEEDSAPICHDAAAVHGEGLERMFLDYYGLNEQPFGVTPDPKFLYLGSKHREALTALTYGTELNRGILTLVAKPGMGKTSILFQYLDQLQKKARVAFLFQTDGNARDLMRQLLADLDLDGGTRDLVQMRLTFNRFLTEQMLAGRPFVLVIDEAQNLDEKVLEFIRLLSNFEKPSMKLMQIVLAGQPQLAERLAKPSMAQLRQRVSFAIRIEPLTRYEIDQYINHRLCVAGYTGLPLFHVGAQALLAERSEGIPRNINNLCFCAMSFAWAMKQERIDRETLRDALSDLDTGSPYQNEVLAPKSPGEVKLSASQTVGRGGLATEGPSGGG